MFRREPADVQKLQGELKELNEQIKNLTANNSRASESLAAKEKMLSDLQSQLHLAKESQTAIKTENERLVRRAGDLERTLGLESIKASELKTQVDKLTKLKEEYTEYKTVSASHLNDSIAAERKIKENAIKEVKEKHAVELALKEKELVKKDIEQDQFKVKASLEAAALENEVKRARQDAQGLYEKNKDFATQIPKLELEIKALELKKAELDSTIAEKQTEIASLLVTLDAQKVAYKELEQKKLELKHKKNLLVMHIKEEAKRHTAALAIKTEEHKAEIVAKINQHQNEIALLNDGHAKREQHLQVNIDKLTDNINTITQHLKITKETEGEREAVISDNLTSANLRITELAKANRTLASRAIANAQEKVKLLKESPFKWLVTGIVAVGAITALLVTGALIVTGLFEIAVLAGIMASVVGICIGKGINAHVTNKKLADECKRTIALINDEDIQDARSLPVELPVLRPYPTFPKLAEVELKEFKASMSSHPSMTSRTDSGIANFGKFKSRDRSQDGVELEAVHNGTAFTGFR